LAVNPSTRELIGFDPAKQFLRISSDLADGHPLVQTAQVIPLAQGITYRNDTLYLGQKIGKVYRVDPVTGNTTMVDSTALGIGGMDFNPLTGQLWIGIGVGTITDGIYKVSIPNGRPTLVGRTGLGTGVTDLMFDGAGDLYGVITSSGNATLVRIDTTTGAGHRIGAMGVPGMTAISMIPDSLIASLSYDSTNLNSSRNDTLLLQNPGLSPITLNSAAVSDAAEFSVSPSSGTIPASGNIPVVVTFSPLSVGTKNANIVFAFNAPLRNGAVSVTGLALAPANRTASFGSYWNLVSVPLSVPDYRTTLLYPTATSGAFSFNGGYAQKDTLINGTGYWLQFASAQNVEIGGYLGESNTFSVASGWNIIGSTADSVPTAVITATGTRIKTLFWGYNAGYRIADTVLPGKGYWLKVDSAGHITLPAQTSASPKVKPSVVMQTIAALNALHLEDAAGVNQTLYYGLRTGKEGDDGLYEMPPVAPHGAFDARFNSNQVAEFIDNGASNVLPIQLTSAKYPVRLTWNVKSTVISGTLKMNGREIPLAGIGGVDVPNAQSVLSLVLKGSKANLPVAYALEQNFPNPFNPTTRIAYALPQGSRVTLKIYDVLGREVTTLVNEQQSAGFKSVEWNSTNASGEGVPSGVYFYRIQAGSFSQTKKLLLLK
jgi:hypothetical protein